MSVSGGNLIARFRRRLQHEFPSGLGRPILLSQEAPSCKSLSIYMQFFTRKWSNIACSMLPPLPLSSPHYQHPLQLPQKVKFGKDEEYGHALQTCAKRRKHFHPVFGEYRRCERDKVQFFVVFSPPSWLHNATANPQFSFSNVRTL